VTRNVAAIFSSFKFSISGTVMPYKAWSTMRERQYAHVKNSLLESGKPETLAKEIAARVVNKERAQHGESATASASSINDMSAGRRGGFQSQPNGVKDCVNSQF
jgi:hypothetical protein